MQMSYEIEKKKKRKEILKKQENELWQVPTPTPTRLFSFMNPLAVEIWLFLLLAYVLVSLSMWVVARFTPYEWHDNVNGSGLGTRCHHCQHYLSDSIGGGINQILQLQQQQQHQLNHDALFNSEHPVLASSNDFSLANSFWFTIGTLMQQGSDLNPKVFFCRRMGRPVDISQVLPSIFILFFPRGKCF